MIPGSEVPIKNSIDHKALARQIKTANRADHVN